MLNKMSKEFVLFIVYWHDVVVSFRRNNEMYFVIKIESGGHKNILERPYGKDLTIVIFW